MIKLSKDNYKRQLDIHGWAGLIFGFLLYVIVFTGALVVFVTELSQWSVSGQVAEQPINPEHNQSIDTSIQKLLTKVPESYRQHITIRQTYDGHLRYTFLQTNNESSPLKKVESVEFLVNPSNLSIEQPDGRIDIVASSWVRFIRKFHTDLYIPGFLSRYIVGIFGMLLLVATISGFLIHRHLIKELFLSPRLSSRTVNERDGHNLAGTWSLPFAFVLAFTGAYICFDTRVGLPVVVMTAFNGNIDAAIDHVLDEPNINEIPKSSQSAQIDDIVTSSKAHTTVAPTQVEIIGYQSAQTLVTTYHPALNIENDVFYHELVFNGNNGQFIRETDNIGYKPTVSSRSVQLMETLHYGNFSGWLSKLIWFLLSIVLCHVILTGFRLWFEKRLKQKHWQRLYVSVPILSYGLPIAFMCSGIGYFLSHVSLIPLHEILAIWWGFGMGWALCFVGLFGVCFFQQNKKMSNNDSINLKQTEKPSDVVISINKMMAVYLSFITALLCLCMPVIRWAFSGKGWQPLFASGDITVIVVDVFFVLVGGLFFRKALYSTAKLKAKTVDRI